MTMQEMAASIPHEYREKILLNWLPNAKADMSNESMRLLFEAYFIYIEPSAVQKPECQKCVKNVLENWQHLSDHLVEAEREYNLLNAI